MLKIKGFQKLTLLDYPGRTAASIFTEGCNFCCPFCHNASLVYGKTSGEYITEDQILSHLKKRVGKLSGLCISGGEPLLQKELPAFIHKVKELGYFVKLDTNGSLPLALQRLMEENLLDYVAMDIKNCKEKYAMTSGIEEGQCEEKLLKAVGKSIQILRDGSIPFEFRTTIVKELHTMEDVSGMGEWISGHEAFFLQSFVDSGDTITPGLTACTQKEMEDMQDALRAFVPKACIRGL
ncbi:MAG: anaerobic ribonucleoside-triphosphate reductase activating protein [Clostridia bacterium]|nr:anaerobic ribonucleoside-triphosphate reductase activating protein [Clostridia bacterium]